MNDVYRIVKVANGWMLDNTDYCDKGMIYKNDNVYVFSTSKKLAKFIKKLDDKGNGNES